VGVTAAALRIGLPLTIGSVSSFVLSSGDRLIIQGFGGLEEVGRYQVAYTVGSVAIILLGFVQSAWLARLASLRDLGQRAGVMTAARDELLRVVAPVIVALTLGGPVALVLMSTAAYRPETLLPVIFVIAASAVPVVLAVSASAYLVTLRRGRA